jgi:hypothetical protein
MLSYEPARRDLVVHLDNGERRQPIGSSPHEFDDGDRRVMTIAAHGRRELPLTI